MNAREGSEPIRVPRSMRRVSTRRTLTLVGSRRRARRSVAHDELARFRRARADASSTRQRARRASLSGRAAGSRAGSGSASGAAGRPSWRSWAEPPGPRIHADVLSGVRHVLRHRPRPLALLRERGGRPGPRVGDVGRGPDAPEPHRLRGRGEDGLHDELRVERDRADGERARGDTSAIRRSAAAAWRSRTPSRPPSGWRRRRSRSTATSLAPATAAPTSSRSRGSVAEGELDLESLGRATPRGAPGRRAGGAAARASRRRARTRPPTS